jgi:hypothetical protein
MLGQPVSMLIPQVVGFRSRASSRGRDATDLVLTVTEMLRARASSASSSSSTAPASPACRSPTGRRSPTWPPSTARPAASSPSTRRRSLPRAHRPRPGAHRARRGVLPKEQGLFHDPGDAGGRVLRHVSSSTSATVEPSSPARAGRRTGCRCRRVKASFLGELPSSARAGRRQPKRASPRATAAGGRRRQPRRRRRGGETPARSRPSRRRSLRDSTTARW